MSGRKKAKQKKRESESEELLELEQDETFYYIAGYTEGGFPYGTTWEEHEAQELEEMAVHLSRGGGRPMKEMKLTKRQFEEIVGAHEMVFEGMESFLNIETGEVKTLGVTDGDEDDETLSEAIEEGYNEVYFIIPPKDSHQGYEDMRDFTDTVEDEALQDELFDILSGGRRIFRRFKDALDKEHTERYYLYLEERNRERVKAWLKSIGVKLILE